MKWAAYPKYKESGVEWLGDVPEDWEVKRLDFLASVKARLGWKGLTASEYIDGGYVFLATPNIKGENGIDFENVNYITEERYLESPEIMLQENDVLIAKDGSTLGITNVVRSLPRPATVNSSIAVIRSKDKIHSRYLFRWLSSSFMQAIIESLNRWTRSSASYFKLILENLLYYSLIAQNKPPSPTFSTGRPGASTP